MSVNACAGLTGNDVLRCQLKQRLFCPGPTEMLKLLESSDRDCRLQAAWGLCLLGERAGVPALLDMPAGNTWTLFEINAVRQPAAWAKAAGRIATGEFEGSRQEVLDRLAKQAGLSLEWP